MAANNTGNINIRVNIQQAVQQLQTLNTTLKNVSDKATVTNRKLAGLSTSLKAHTEHLRTIRDLTQRSVRVQDTMNQMLAGSLGQLRLLNTQMAQQIKLLTQLAQAQGRVNNTQRQNQEHSSSLIAQFMQLAAAIGVTTSAIDIFKSSLNVTKEIDSINKTFYAITGTMNGANMEMSYVRQMAQGLGLDFMSLAKSYKGFSAATKYANMDMATSKEIFESVAGAATVLGLSGQKTELTLMALEQMVSKGVVSMEELRRQLGDQLPGAFELGAKAMKMGLAEFNKFVASGQLMTEDFLPRFARTLKDTYATVENLGMAVKTPRAELQKLSNELLFMQDTFARHGFLETVVTGVRELTAALQREDVRQNIIELGRSFGVLVSAGMSLVKFIAEHTTLIKTLLIALLTWKISNMALSGTLNVLGKSSAWTAGALQILAGRTTAVGAAAAGANLFLQKWGATILGLGNIALTALSVGLMIALPLIEELSNKIDYSKEFADKFGVSVGEAEAQLATFLAVAAKTDPLVQLNKQLAELTDRLREIKNTTDSGFGNMLSRMQDAIKGQSPDVSVIENMDYTDVLDPTGAATAVDWINPERLKQQSEQVTAIFQQMYAEISSGSFSTGKSLATYFDGMKKILLQVAKDTKNDWMPVFQYLEQAGVATLNTLEQKQQIMLQIDIAKVSTDWAKVANLTEEVRTSIDAVGKVTKNLRLGQDLDADIKSFESVLKLVDKWYLKSEEGLKEEAKKTRTQLENADKIAEAWAETGKIKIAVEKAMIEATMASVKQQIAHSQALIVQIGDEADARVQAAKVSIEAYNKVLEAQGLASAALDASLASIEKRVQEIKSRQGAALKQFENDLQKKTDATHPKNKNGSANKDQSILQNLISEADKARTALKKLQDTHAELVAQMQGDTWEAKIAKINKTSTNEIEKLNDSLAKLQQRFNEMKKGPQRDAAAKELATLKELTVEQQRQIEQNAELERQLVRRQQLITSFSEAAIEAKNAGDFTEYWRQKVQQLNEELSHMKPGTSGYAEKQQEAKIAQMRQEWDMLGLASERTKQWSYDTAMSIQDSFANIIPNALDSTIDAFTTCFTDVIWGSKNAQDAWQAFTDAISNMGKQIIRMLIEIALKMLVLKMVSGIGGLFAEDGAVVDGNSVQTAANGRVVGSGAKPIAFASGGILAGPQLFQTQSGTPVIAGEAGPEAFVPLGRTREGKLGIETTGGQGLSGGNVVMVVNVYNNASDQVHTTQQQGQDKNGNPQIDIFIEQIDAALAKRIGQGRSNIGRAMDKTRGTSSSRALYS